MVLSALIFDVDGTLANTERDGHRLAFNQAFKKAGLDWEWSIADYGKLLSIAGGKERIKAFLERKRLQQLSHISKSFIQDLHAQKTYYFLQWMQQGPIRMRPGVCRLLYEARDCGLRLAIATTTTQENVSALLKLCLPEGSSLFEFIGSGDQVRAKKPAPDIYHLVLTKMALSQEQCLALEDSGQGLRSALAAGIPTLVTANEYTLEHNFSGALLVLDQLGEVGHPCRRLSGQATWPGGVVDVALLRALHQTNLCAQHAV